MEKGKKTLALILMAVLAFSFLAGCKPAAKQESSAANGNAVTFTVTADVTGARAPYVERFAQLVAEKTGGRYKANVLAAASLGNASDMGQMLQMGTLDVLMSDDMSMDGLLNGALGFAWLPGLVSNYDEADKYYLKGWISDQIAAIMAQNKLIRISSYCNGFRQVGNVKRPITEMKDIAGLKIRTPSVNSVVSFYEKCGALPVMIAGSEVLSALQTGTVDGLDNAVFNYINQGITDVIKYITELNYCYSGGCFMASPNFWGKLSPDDQAIFKDCAQIASDEFTKHFRDETDKLVKDGVQKGQWVVSQPSDAMKAKLKDIYAAIWKENYEKYGKTIMDPIISGEYKTLSGK